METVLKKKTFMRPMVGATIAFTLATVPHMAWAVDDVAPADDAQAADIVELDLYNLTDIHGHIERVEKTNKETQAVSVREAGLAAVQCYLDGVNTQGKNFTFTLLGDNIGASPFTSGSQKDNPTIEALNELPVVGSTIGNHELDLGQEVFKKRIDGSAPDEFVKLNFPYLGANVKGMGSYTENGVDTPYLKNYIIAERAGVKIAFIGAIAQDVPFKLSPDTTKGLTFEDPIAEISTLAKSLKANGQADVVVAMLDDDVKNNYPKMPAEVDVLMGGDTHVPYEFDHVDSAVTLTSANPRLAGIASGSYTDNLGLVRLQFDKTAKKVLSADSILIPAGDVVGGSAADCLTNSTAGAVVAKAKEAAKAAGNVEVVSGVTAQWRRGVFLKPGEDTPGPGSNRGVESTLGNLVADAIHDQVTVDGKTPVDFGVVNAGGLRADLIPDNGVLTYADTFKALPFSNELGYSPMTGAQFKQALENQWKENLNSQNSRPMLRLGTSSNLTYTYDPSRPMNERITSILLNGEPMDMAKTYNVGSMTFVLQGGDGYFEKGLPVTTFGQLDRDGFNAYLKKVTGPELKSATLKRGVGITLPDAEILNNDFSIALRGLSFTEGEGISPKVTVNLGSASQTVDVDNNLLEANAENAQSVITTDGAGQATAMFTIVEVCGDKTGMQAFPVTAANEFGQLIKAESNLTVNVDCGMPIIGGEDTNTDDDHANTPGNSHGTSADDNKANDEMKTKPSQPQVVDTLAKTGVSLDIVALALLAMLAGVAGVAISRRQAR
ncbi:bifunctional metallophosphatase/5'-nucleotidase [Arcanobacterium pinnipediorum]|uniref:5'-nucleotidase C-terminal domain-containing protein n=1 Tax=Arcanobacterium pinnipediorum TaxID=1503041 RepID=A0ABY5AGC6_9ACTO|nr:5'-nucleotidase C-terminal domain-containing protein [Arcanobacterium pinnipediorum]USR78915.1 5'-nucleotidase C-terminal domain-containing protein [Arcanobacterium pinnipediorum]